MSGIDSEDGRKSVEIQEYEYFLYFDRNGIVWFKDLLRKGLAIETWKSIGRSYNLEF